HRPDVQGEESLTAVSSPADLPSPQFHARLKQAAHSPSADFSPRLTTQGSIRRTRRPARGPLFMGNPDATPTGSSRASAALFLISILGLFLELMLIRWVSTEVRIFAYLQNTVLVVCFLGLGLGCWTCRQATSAREALFPLFVLVLLLAL